MPLLMTEIFSHREREREQTLSLLSFLHFVLITLFSILFQLIIYLFSDTKNISQ